MKFFAQAMTAAILLMILSPIHAQNAKRFISADPANVDDDFAFQGEYAGLILPDVGGPSSVYRQVGIQVVALGDGKFDAVQFDFGLPGAGWNKSNRIRMSGERNGDVLELKGEHGSAIVQNNLLLLKSAAGNNMGSFPRVIRTSPTLGQKPPLNAIVLFDGTAADEFHNGRITEDGLLMEGADFKRVFNDFTLHVEFRLPYMPNDQAKSEATRAFICKVDMKFRCWIPSVWTEYSTNAGRCIDTSLQPSTCAFRLCNGKLMTLP